MPDDFATQQQVSSVVLGNQGIFTMIRASQNQILGSSFQLVADSNACCGISRLRVAGNLANVYLGEQGAPGYIPGWRLLFVLGGLLAGLISVVIAIFMATSSDGIDELSLMRSGPVLEFLGASFSTPWGLITPQHMHASM